MSSYWFATKSCRAQLSDFWVCNIHCHRRASASRGRRLQHPFDCPRSSQLALSSSTYTNMTDRPPENRRQQELRSIVLQLRQQVLSLTESATAQEQFFAEGRLALQRAIDKERKEREAAEVLHHDEIYALKAAHLKELAATRLRFEQKGSESEAAEFNYLRSELEAAQGRERAQEETMRGLRHEYWQDSQAQMKVLRAAHEKEVAGLREQLQSKSELIQQLQLRSRPARTQFNAVLSELKAGADGRAAGHTAAAARRARASSRPRRRRRASASPSSRRRRRRRRPSSSRRRRSCRRASARSSASSRSKRRRPPRRRRRRGRARGRAPPSTATRRAAASSRARRRRRRRRRRRTRRWASGCCASGTRRRSTCRATSSRSRTWRRARR